MPGLFFLDFVSLRAFPVATWLKPLLKDETELWQPYCLFEILNFWLDLFLETFLSWDSVELVRAKLFVSGVCNSLSFMPRSPDSWLRRSNGKFLCESLWLFIHNTSFPLSTSSSSKMSILINYFAFWTHQGIKHNDFKSCMKFSRDIICWWYLLSLLWSQNMATEEWFGEFVVSIH